MRRVSLLGILLLALSSFPPAAPARPSASQQSEVLTNESVIAMSKAGLSVEILLEKIRISETSFDLSSAALIELKRERVADEVIKLMLERGETSAPSPRTRLRRAQATGDAPIAAPAREPVRPPESGIYLYRPSGDEYDLVKLEPAVYFLEKDTGAWKTAISYGVLKTQSKAVLAGQHAKLQVDTPTPVFYFYFDVTTAGLSHSGGAWAGPATSANEFVLVRMDAKKSGREVVVGQYSRYTGEQNGTLEKHLRPFHFERLEPGVYRVTIREPLEDGEYCFFYGGAATGRGRSGRSGPRVFDFGITTRR